MKIKDMKWPVLVIAETHDPSGRKIRMSRYIEGGEDVVAAMKLALMSRKDCGFPFLGCEITAVTPAHQIVKRMFDPDTEELI